MVNTYKLKKNILEKWILQTKFIIALKDFINTFNKINLQTLYITKKQHFFLLKEKIMTLEIYNIHVFICIYI